MYCFMHSIYAICTCTFKVVLCIATKIALIEEECLLRLFICLNKSHCNHQNEAQPGSDISVNGAAEYPSATA